MKVYELINELSKLPAGAKVELHATLSESEVKALPVVDVDESTDAALIRRELFFHIIICGGFHHGNHTGGCKDGETTGTEGACGEFFGDNHFIFVSISDLHGEILLYIVLSYAALTLIQSLLSSRMRI